MFKNLLIYLLKKIYRFLIWRTVILDKNTVRVYDKMVTFCSVTIPTDKGPFTFIFKEDRRKRKRAKLGIFYINNYVIELCVPEGLASIDKIIENKVVIVVKIMLFKVNYNILTEVLTDLYLDNILQYIRSNETSESKSLN